MHQLRGFYAKKLVETRQTIERLSSLESELQESLSYLQGCHSCDPVTPRTACRACDETPHQDTHPPAMVAAIHDPA